MLVSRFLKIAIFTILLCIVGSMTVRAEIKNPAKRFKDPLAEKVSWEPMAKNSSNFESEHLVPVEGVSYSMEIAMTWKMAAFSIVFGCVGILILTGGIFLSVKVFRAKDKKKNGILPVVLMIFLGCGFTAAGIFSYKASSKLQVFDRNSGFYSTKGSQVSLNKIHALQVLRKYISDKDSHYYCYEINLVMDGGSRINIMSHGVSNRIWEDAKTLAKFLEVPVWKGY